MRLTDSPQNEYWFHVSNQSEIPIAGTVDKSIDSKKLKEISKNIPDKELDSKKYVIKILLKNPDLIHLLRTLVGVSNKRMYLELSYLFSKKQFEENTGENILGYSLYDLQKKPLDFFVKSLDKKNIQLSTVSSELITNYLLDKGLFTILNAIKKINIHELDILIEKLILTKEVQQAEAKRRGHGAEFELAQLINNLGVKIEPQSRHINPMGSRDPNVDRINFELSKKIPKKTWSFDIIIKDENDRLLSFIQSLIHTSDPGQYGVNKSDETVLIKLDLNKYNTNHKDQKKELWGLVDGVGFCENKKGTIDKLLEEFDCFIQLKSLYKVGLKLHSMKIIKIKGISFDTNFYSQEESRLMYEKYCSADIKNITKKPIPSDWTTIQAGMATLHM